MDTCEYPIMKYTPYCIPFKRHRTAEIIWPRQPRESVFSTIKVIAVISGYVSDHPLTYALTVCACIYPQLSRRVVRVHDMLDAWVPGTSEASTAMFLEKDKRGLAPWMELARCTGAVVIPAPITMLLPTAVSEETWLLAQTTENQRVLVRVSCNRVCRVLNVKVSSRAAAMEQHYDRFVGAACTMKECLSVNSRTKRFFLVLVEEKLQWSIVGYGSPIEN